MTPDPNSNNRIQRRSVLRKGAVAASGIALGIGVISGSAAAQTVITEPTVIDEPGHYVLGNDVSGPAGVSGFFDTCIGITADNVTLDGNGYSVSSGSGIRTSVGVQNITIRDLTADGADSVAISLRDQSTVQNVDAQGMYGGGVLVGESSRIINSSIDSIAVPVSCGSNSTVQGNTINRSPDSGSPGIRLRDVDGITVTNNTMSPPGFSWNPAIELRNADDNRIVNNSVLGDAQVGIRIDSDSDNNTVTRNDLRGVETPIEDDGTNTRLVANRTE